MPMIVQLLEKAERWQRGLASGSIASRCRGYHAGKFGADFDRVAKGGGIRVVRTAVQAPLMNSVCERFLGSVRRDCLDHVIALGERHLSQVLKEYCFRYFNIARPRQGIRRRVPVDRALNGALILRELSPYLCSAGFTTTIAPPRDNRMGLVANTPG